MEKIYQIRLTVPRQDDKVSKYCKKYSPLKYAFGAEVGSATEKPHYHVYIESKTSRQTLVNNLKKEFGVSGNESFSLSIAKYPIQCLAYCIKDGCVESFGIDLSTVPKYEPYGVSKRSLKTKTFTAQLLEDYGSRVLSPRSICDWVQDYLRDKAKIHDKFIVFRFSHLVVSLHCPTGYAERRSSWSEDFASELKGFKMNPKGICQSEKESPQESRRGVSFVDPDFHVYDEAPGAVLLKAHSLWSTKCQDPSIIQSPLDIVQLSR